MPAVHLVLLAALVLQVLLSSSSSPSSLTRSLTGVGAARCGFYVPEPHLNEYANPSDPHYDPHRESFGPPAVCDSLIEPQRVFYIPDVNGTTKSFIQTEAFRKGLCFVSSLVVVH